jgi:hypothetical protein
MPGALHLQQPVDRYGEQLNVIPRAYVAYLIGQIGYSCENVRAKSIQTSCSNTIRGALGKHIRALVIITAIDGKDKMATPGVR